MATTRLAALRRQRGLLLDYIAEVCGVSRSKAYRWETGRAQPEPRQWPALAALLGTETRELVEAFYRDTSLVPPADVVPHLARLMDISIPEVIAMFSGARSTG